MNIAIFKNPKQLQLLFLSLVIIVAIFFRFWQIRDYVVFLGDEGRDMLVMKRMIMDGKIPFIGPTASVGGFYLGPIYYWMAAPFLALWRLDPVGPSYMVAVFGVLTVLILYKFLKETVGIWPAFLASLLYATTPLIVRYSRSSWNPNPLPFFALLMVYFLYLGVKKNKLALGPQPANWRARTASYAYFLFAGACFGIAIQLHYLALILLAIALAVILVNTSYKGWIFILILLVAGFLFTFSPFLLFEIRHNFPNFRTITEFVTRGTTVGYKTTNFVWLISNIGNIFLEEITTFRGTVITKAVFWILAAGGAIGLFQNWGNKQSFPTNKEKKLIFSSGTIWFLGGLAGLRFYTGQVFDYYFGFMFPAPFFLAGLVISLFWNKSIARVLILLVFSATLVWFLKNGFYKNPPNKLIKQTENVAKFVVDKSDGKPFNFALISDHNSDHAYRYFLEISGHKPTELEELITEQLLVVCESQKCAPLGYPSWEIAGFGRAEIAGEWELPNIGIRVFRLTHWPGAPNPAGKPAVKGV